MNFPIVQARLLRELHRNYSGVSREDLQDAVSGAFASCCHLCATCTKTDEHCFNHLHLSARRNLKREHTHHVQQPAFSSSSASDRRELLALAGASPNNDAHQTLEWAFSKLKKETAYIIKRHFEGFQFRIIAEKLGKPEKTVESLYTRGLEKLHEILLRESSGGGGGEMGTD